MNIVSRTPPQQKCGWPGCHHPFAAHEAENGSGSQLKCLACGCSDFVYDPDNIQTSFVSSPQEIKPARKKIEHVERKTPPAQARAPGA
jgi:hypothetical protein